jgi:uncharacterized membrane protein
MLQSMGLFFIFVPLLLLAGIILGLVAISDVRDVRSTLKSFPLDKLTFRIYQLEQKVAELQKKLAAAAPPAPVAAQPAVHPAPEPQPAAPPPEPPKVSAPLPPQAASPPKPAPPSLAPPSSPQIPVPPPHAPQSLPAFAGAHKEPSSSDLEELIGGRWFNRIGIIAILFAVSYFLKLAFDNNWIGPAGRVAIGILLGLLMLPWSDWLLSRDYTYFSEGIAGLGEATLFVSVWAGCQYYRLFTQQVGFVALVIVTGIMAFLALRWNSERIGFISLLGGLLTPALMSTGRNEQVVLFSYLLLLGAAALYVSWRKEWQSLMPLAFGATYLYFWQWYDVFYRRGAFLGSTLFFATLIFLLFSILPAARALLRQALRAWDVIFVLFNAFAYLVILYELLWDYFRWPLALFLLVLAIVHEAVALLLPDPNADEAAAPQFLYTAVAVSCLTFIIPTKLEHNSITFALAIEGAALVWIGFRYLANLLRPFGYLLLFFAAVRALILPPAAGTFLFNERFGTYLFLIAALGVCLWGALSSSSNSSRPSAPHTLSASPLGPAPSSRIGVAQTDTRAAEAGFLTFAINFFALLALSLEFWDFFGASRSTPGNSLAQHLSISVFWTAYAAFLLIVGMTRNLPILRWQALFLLGVVVLKVFFYDLSFLDRAYRILSFLILGCALLAISFLYQRKLARDRSVP